MTATVDPDLCIGCGICEEECPEVFRLREDGLAYVIAASPDPETYGCIRDSADLCPTDAISVSV